MFGLITVGEYVEYYQPDVAATLCAWPGVISIRPVLSLPFGEWKRVMEERPKPGRGGVLGGEELA